MQNQTSTKFSLWCSRILAGIVLLLCIAMSDILDWYQSFRPLGVHGAAAIFHGYYLCVPAVGLALWRIDGLLRRILGQQVFVPENVQALRLIRWCCAWVSLVCLLAGGFYQPLLFLAAIMAFLALMVSVVKNVMAAAVELREENDLTI